MAEIGQRERDVKTRLMEAMPEVAHTRAITDNGVLAAFELHKREMTDRIAEGIFIAICGSQTIEVTDYAAAASKAFELADEFVTRAFLERGSR